MKKHLPADADRAVWIVTASLVAITLFLLGLAGGIGSMPVWALATLYALAGVGALILFVSWLARPIRYEVRDDSLSIVRSWLFSNIVIPKSTIKEVKHHGLGEIKPESIAIAWIFGYAGRFHSSEAGSVILLGTNPTHAVIVHADKVYALTPSNPKRFMHDLSGKK